MEIDYYKDRYISEKRGKTFNRNKLIAAKIELINLENSKNQINVPQVNVPQVNVSQNRTRLRFDPVRDI